MDLDLSYMEVAVTGTTLRTQSLRTLVLAIAFSFVGGCADMLQKPGEARNAGVKLYNKGKYADAAGAFASATRKDPRDYQAYYYLGRSYESLKQYHQAIGTY